LESFVRNVDEEEEEESVEEEEDEEVDEERSNLKWNVLINVRKVAKRKVLLTVAK
jgi:hypothetical protein